jgi:hypothetical protein
VAAGLSLYLAIRDRKDTSISCSTPMIVEFNRLVGVNKISSELGNKNMAIKFLGYNPRAVERVSAEVEGNELNLVVIPKPGNPPPQKEQIQISYSGVSADTVILIGGTNTSHFPQIEGKDLAGAKILHLGTRPISLGAGKEPISFARPGSSVSEVVATLINESGFSLDPDIATNLLMGIEEGSREFKGPDVSAETFEVVARLMKAGGKRIPPKAVTPAFRPFVQRVTPPPQAPSQPTPVAPMPAVEAVEPEPPKEPPKDWLEPKIYKGTSIS